MEKYNTIEFGRYFIESLFMVLFVLLVCICIGSVLNILLNMTKKRDWLITFLISLGLSIIIVPLLNTF
jgi:branched-subunit amino acid ABC-type transport system permease component